MIKLIITALVAGLIAVGVYLYTQNNSASNTVQQGASQIQNAGDAVQQTQDLQDKINQKATEQLGQ